MRLLQALLKFNEGRLLILVHTIEHLHAVLADIEQQWVATRRSQSILLAILLDLMDSQLLWRSRILRQIVVGKVQVFAVCVLNTAHLSLFSGLNLKFHCFA